ncbi:MAG TPA: hypothetical protein VHR41_02010 [Gemmatimonadales bacterium]|jgi:hypothetical protein|nr:hypothetical protein [Gemmatimonadales bacterium]
MGNEGPRRPENTQEFVAMWNAVTEEALMHKLTGVLPPLARGLSSPLQLGELQAEALSPVLLRAFQIAASPQGGVGAAVQFLGELAADATAK